MSRRHKNTFGQLWHANWYTFNIFCLSHLMWVASTYAYTQSYIWICFLSNHNFFNAVNCKHNFMRLKVFCNGSFICMNTHIHLYRKKECLHFTLITTNQINIFNTAAKYSDYLLSEWQNALYVVEDCKSERFAFSHIALP